MPQPDFYITGVGTMIFDMSSAEMMKGFAETLNEGWDLEAVRQIVSDTEGITEQPPEQQHGWKSSWFWHDKGAEDVAGLEELIRSKGVAAQAVYSSGRDLDILPARANKGNAVTWLCGHLGIGLDEIVVAGDTGNDSSMFLLDGVLGIAPGNAEPELLDNPWRKPRPPRVGKMCCGNPGGPCPLRGVRFRYPGETEKPNRLMSENGDAPPTRKLDILHISIHGLIRGENMELGRDPDTGGQCLYVLELVKALSKDERIRRVSLLTRRVFDPKVSDDYAEAREVLADNADIIRIEAGPRRYLRKEVVWRHLDAFIDGTLTYLRREKRVPDLIHAHYADAGYVGRQVAAVLGCPFVFTGHSLGRVKRQRLVEGGVDSAEMEKRYNLAARIEAEELQPGRRQHGLHQHPPGGRRAIRPLRPAFGKPDARDTPRSRSIEVRRAGLTGDGGGDRREARAVSQRPVEAGRPDHRTRR